MLTLISGAIILIYLVFSCIFVWTIQFVWSSGYELGVESFGEMDP